MSAQISALGEIFIAKLARKRSLSRMFSKMVGEIARLFENTTTSWHHAFKVELLALGLWVFDLDSLMPVAWYALKVLGCIV